jgi:cytochrome c553
VAAAALFVAAAAPGATPFLREQAWTAPGETLARDMTHAPAECLAAASTEIEIGRALFRSPNLLGGPAARSGLSCHACHSNGRVNANFLMPELTDRAGAADVTSEWSSKVRGDGVMNPVAIPDLAGLSTRNAFGRAREPSLERFVRGVIEEEFQGPPPTAQAMAGLLAYLRALQPCAAPEASASVAAAGDDVRRALAAALSAEPATGSLLLLAAQDAVGRIVERLPARGFARERARLEALSRELGALRANSGVGQAAPGWRARFDAALSRIARRERRTYFNAETLTRALRRTEAGR